MAIDTLRVARRRREAGFTEPQAEAVVAAVQEGTLAGDLATRAGLDRVHTGLKTELADLRAELKAEIAELRAELKAEIAEVRAEIAGVRAELKAEIADLRSELRQSDLRSEAKLEAVKAEILKSVFGLILGALVVNIVAIIGAVLAVAKLLGH